MDPDRPVSGPVAMSLALIVVSLSWVCRASSPHLAALSDSLLLHVGQISSASVVIPCLHIWARLPGFKMGLDEIAGQQAASGTTSKTSSDHQNPTTPGFVGSQPSTIWTTSTTPTQWMPGMQSTEARSANQPCCNVQKESLCLVTDPAC